jgi:hypothetical protein
MSSDLSGRAMDSGTITISGACWIDLHKSLEQSAYCLQIFFYCLCSYNNGLLHTTEYFKSLWKNSEKPYSQKHLANASCAVFLASRDTPFVAEKLIRSGQIALCWENAFQNVPRQVHAGLKKSIACIFTDTESYGDSYFTSQNFVRWSSFGLNCVWGMEYRPI